MMLGGGVHGAVVLGVSLVSVPRVRVYKSLVASDGVASPNEAGIYDDGSPPSPRQEIQIKA